jgi:hypothetical protein
MKAVFFGLAVCGALLYMFFFATAGSIQVVVLLGTVAMLLWFGTAHPARLVDAAGRPHWRLFMLALVGLSLLVSAMVALSSGTMLLTLATGLISIAVGMVRAIRHGLRREV